MTYLTSDQVSFFNSNGYLAVPGLFNIDEVSLLSEYSDDLEVWPEVRGKYMKYYEDDKALINRIENFLPYHHKMNALLHQSRFVERLSLLFDDAPVLFKDKINYKKPGGSDFKPHQDIQAGWQTYAQNFISVAIALDETTVENGCLQIGVGNYRPELHSKMWEPMTEADLEGFSFEYVPQKPGDVIFFDGYVPHKSDHNNTSFARRNIYLTYNPLSEGMHSVQYYADKRANYPPDFEREGKSFSYKV
jgi:2-aminoethylphosphonate dioxygenase